MTNKEYYGYRSLKDINARMLVMPYAGDKFCLVIILPKAIDGIYEVEEKMSKTNLMKELQLVTHPEVEVFLPRFKIESKLDLTNDLKSLGIVSLFDPEISDFSGLIKTKGLYLNKVVQKTVIDVNDESGFLGHSILTAPKRISTEQRRFKVDHPFLFYVVNTEWQNVLYVGRYKMPEGPGCTMSSSFSFRG
ncbi:Alaserpin [Gryllus bimaculatus]|nr:Alaserpin [Gryllus bimaculatus]